MRSGSLTQRSSVGSKRLDEGQPRPATEAPVTRYALLSVSDKTGLVPFARALVDLGFTLLSTGGTGRTLEQAGLPVTPVSEHTGAPEIMNGRVKTLHPRIHGGILGDRERHAEEAREQGIPWIELVAVNLYPFESTVAREGVTTAQVVEQIDIGGPTMVRAAAKNHAHVTVVVDPSDYDRVAQALTSSQELPPLRQELAVKAFRHTARYDGAISAWLAQSTGAEPLASELGLGLSRVQPLRYGENPHQRAAFYADPSPAGRSLARARQIQGKPLSFNNLNDLDGALRTVFEVEQPACAIIKHTNPAGFATAPDLSTAFERALQGDPVSAFGGIVVFNRPVDGATIRTLKLSKTFFEVVAAPGFDALALERLAPRENLRVVELPEDWASSHPPGVDARRVQGGWLLQDWDVGAPFELRVVTERSPTADEARALDFAWRACRGVKSNAIVLGLALTDGARLNGVGAGQMSRVDAVQLAVSKATASTAGNVLASDAFFPFADGLKVAAEAGVSAVIQPGGSVRDAEVIAAANEAGIAMVFTGTRHFRH
ncbi:MAG: bifunctional phosphoribosylaminoimidazolecarboxamide formyltransferase/IMP cyclohydrolase PurH [Deltaproteobacteria bacterium]|nr:MAG: bifunctional phosphoribosylaminoimidazolecarboxamide formyltransferase/IMP cyclohydrolase PurH [Deltaproteobacteria bacterium]